MSSRVFDVIIVAHPPPKIKRTEKVYIFRIAKNRGGLMVGNKTKKSRGVSLGFKKRHQFFGLIMMLLPNV